MADILRQVDETVSRLFRDMSDSSFAEVLVAVGDQVAVTTATITTGTSLSSGIDLGFYRLARITLPSTWTSADLTFQVSDDGTTWNNLYDMYGSEYKVVGGTGPRTIVLNTSDLLGVRYVKIRSGSSTATVAQAVDAPMVLVLVR